MLLVGLVVELQLRNVGSHAGLMAAAFLAAGIATPLQPQLSIVIWTAPLWLGLGLFWRWKFKTVPAHSGSLPVSDGPSKTTADPIPRWAYPVILFASCLLPVGGTFVYMRSAAAAIHCAQIAKAPRGPMPTGASLTAAQAEVRAAYKQKSAAARAEHGSEMAGCRTADGVFTAAQAVALQACGDAMVVAGARKPYNEEHGNPIL